MKEDEGGVAQYMRDSVVAYQQSSSRGPLIHAIPRRALKHGITCRIHERCRAAWSLSPWWCEGTLERGDFLTTTSDGKRVPRELLTGADS